MTPEQTRDELKRIRKAVAAEAKKTNSQKEELTRAGAIYRILTWLGKETERDPLFRCDTGDLFVNAVGTDKEIESWNTAGPEVRKAYRDSTRRLMLDVRDYITKFYKTEGNCKRNQSFFADWVEQN